MKTRVIACLLFAISGLFFSGCLGPIYGIYEATKPEEDEEQATSPVVVMATPSRLNNTPATIEYTLFDAENDACTIVVEYSAGGDWYPATEGSGGSGTTGVQGTIDGTDHTFIWDYDLTADDDLDDPETVNVQIRIQAVDSEGLAGTDESSGHSLGNRQPEIAAGSIGVSGSAVTGVATIDYTIIDTHGDDADIEVQYQIFGEITWYDATPDSPAAATGINTAPNPGNDGYFPWNSQDPADLEGSDADVLIRMHASDDGGTTWGAWTEALSLLTIKNNSEPRIEMGSTTAHDSGIIYLPYTCYDDEGHDVSVLVEFQPFGSTAWYRASAGPGTSDITFAASPAGTPGVFAWDSKRDYLISRDVTIRITPSESTTIGLAAYSSLSVSNDATEHHAFKTSLPTYAGYGTAHALGNQIFMLGGNGGQTVRAYDPAWDTWTNRGVLTAQRIGLGSAVVNGTLYVVGGFYGGTYYSLCESFNPGDNTWNTLAPMSGGRSKLGVTASGGLIYAIGGENVSSGAPMATMEIYDPVLDSWSSGPDMLTARKGLSCAALNGKIYAAGGRTVPFGGVCAILEIYDTETGTWSTGPSMPRNREDFGLVVADGRIFAVAGWGTGVLSEIDEYDPERNQWITRSSLIKARCTHSAAVLNGKIYALSGWDGTFIPDVEVYVPAAHSWESMPTQPVARSYLGGAGLGGKLHTAGGSPSTTHEEFNPLTNTWAVGTPLLTTKNRPGVAALDGKLYVVSGNPANTIQIFNPGTNNWSAGADIPTPREGCGLAAWGGKIYAIGGHVPGDTSSRIAPVDIYDPVANSWSTGDSMSTPRYFPGIAVVNDEIYAIAGFSTYYTNAVEAYDPVNDSWRSIAPVSARRQLAATISFEGRIYAMGGNGQNGSVDIVDIYDPQYNTWTPGPPLPTPGMTWAGQVGTWGYTFGTSNHALKTSRATLLFSDKNLPAAAAGSGLVILGDEVITIGGGNSAAPALDTVAGISISDIIPASTSQPFDLNHTWFPRASLPVALRDFACTAFNNKIYVIGGKDDSGNPSDAVYEYSPMGDVWTTLTPMSIARFGMGAALIGDSFYIIGGDTGGGTKTGLVEALNLTDLTWSTPTVMTTARSHLGCVEYERRVFAVGGEEAAGAYSAKVEMFDPDQNAWTAFSSLANAVKGPLCIKERGSIKLLGGELDTGIASDQIIRYDKDADIWQEIGIVLPYPVRDLAGVSGWHTWSHRGSNQTDEFCFFAGGNDGTDERDGLYRLHSR